MPRRSRNTELAEKSVQLVERSQQSTRKNKNKAHVTETMRNISECKNKLTNNEIEEDECDELMYNMLIDVSNKYKNTCAELAEVKRYHGDDLELVDDLKNKCDEFINDINYLNKTINDLRKQLKLKSKNINEKISNLPNVDNTINKKLISEINKKADVRKENKRQNLDYIFSFEGRESTKKNKI